MLFFLRDARALNNAIFSMKILNIALQLLLLIAQEEWWKRNAIIDM